jgi:hypothetical protein
MEMWARLILVVGSGSCVQNTMVLMLLPVYGDVGQADNGSVQQQLCTEHEGVDAATCVWRRGPG